MRQATRSSPCVQGGGNDHHRRDEAFWHPVDDVEALVAALEPLMRERECIERSDVRVRAWVVTQFSPDHKADEIGHVYRQIWATGNA
jgi:hypothetical protein